MGATKQQLQQFLALALIGNLLVAIPAMAASDREAQESLAKARAKLYKKDMDHSAHAANDKSLEFHGVFYGFLPCDDCTGIKATLSLKQKDNYLLVTQPAKESSKESYEKGKYVWDEAHQTVILTPTKGGTVKRYYRIESEGKLIQLNSDGSQIGNGGDRYVMERSDMAKTREVHIH